MISKEWIGLAFWFLFALVGVIESYRLDLGSWDAPDAGYFPFVASVLLCLIGLYRLILSIGGHLAAALPFERETVNWGSMGLTLAGMLAYIFLFQWLGFVVCTFLLMAFLIGAVGRKGWLTALTAALSITVASYVLFDVLLDAQMPKGIAGAFF